MCWKILKSSKEKNKKVHCGFIAIAGAPNAGKSTLLNKILGFKLAITSDKPQTTRHRILGVHTEEDLQVIFLDTPGLHKARHALNRHMMDVALEALREAEGILFMVDVQERGLNDARRVAEMVASAGKKVVVGLNKVDTLSDMEKLLPILSEVNSWGEWQALVPVSAQTGLGLKQVMGELKKMLPTGQPLFPPDTLTDLSERFLAAELVREKVFRLTKQDIPYATAVTIDEFIEPDQRNRTTSISATIHVERSGQKAIIIGKGGGMLKAIGTAARHDLERMLNGPVFLKLFVRVEAKWSQGRHGLSKLGY